MRTEDFDGRCLELQTDLINALPTEKLLMLEGECIRVSREVNAKRHRIILILFGLGLLMSLIRSWEIIWFLGALLIFFEQAGWPFLWGLQFSHEKKAPFCLPVWITAKTEQTTAFREWREFVGRDCSVKVIPLPIFKHIYFGNDLKNFLGLEVIWFVMWALAKSQYFYPGGPWWKLLPLILLGAMGYLLIRWRMAKDHPEGYGVGYREVCSVLDSRVGDTPRKR